MRSRPLAIGVGFLAGATALSGIFVAQADDLDPPPTHYEVEAADTWQSIAASHGLTADALQLANNLAASTSNSSHPRTGWVIHIPPAAAPTTTTTTITTTTVPPVTTTTLPPATTTTAAPTTTAPPVATQTLPPGSALPTEAECAARVQGAAEVRPDNTPFNVLKGTTDPTRPGLYARVTGNFTGTTDEIIQWAACKWGFNVDTARAQAVQESWWFQQTGGDFTTNDAHCAPGHPKGADGRPGECAESVGLFQVRWQYHPAGFPGSDYSTAMNADYALAARRNCFEGNDQWLNTVERGREYAAGDEWGCMGVWFSGRWYTQPAETYIAAVRGWLNGRTWETADFKNAQPGPGPDPQPPTAPTTTTTTAPAATTTTAPAVTTTTAPPATGLLFAEPFNQSLGEDSFNTGVFHRERDAFGNDNWGGTFPGAHNIHLADCGDPNTNSHQIDSRSGDSNLFYACREHFMVALGHVSGYSIAWFSPKVHPTNLREVCWDATVSRNANEDRQWWEVAVAPVDHPEATAISWLAGTVNVPSYGDSVVLGFGPDDPPHLSIMTGGANPGPGGDGYGEETERVRAPWGDGTGQPHTPVWWDRDWKGLGKPFDNQAIRVKHCLREVGDRVEYETWGPNGESYKFSAGWQFPEGQVKVVFKNHAYTPDKACGDQPCETYTWHFDNIELRS